MNWIVVILKPNQSKKAEENLINQGFITFFPRITYKYAERLITKDLFPGYAFIKCSQLTMLLSINSTKGVSRVMRINDAIPQLADSLIENIKKQLENLNSSVDSLKSFKKYDRVIIRLRIFNNQEAEVLEVSNKKGSQKALLKILNSSQTFWVNSNYLEVKRNLNI